MLPYHCSQSWRCWRNFWRLSSRRDGSSARLLERIRPEGHSRATGPHPQERPVPAVAAPAAVLEYIVNETWPGAVTGSRATTSLSRSSIVPRRSIPSSTPSCASRPRACETSCANTTTPKGRNDPVRIELPKGSYTPHIEFRQAARLAPGRRTTRGDNSRSAPGAYAGAGSARGRAAAQEYFEAGRRLPCARRPQLNFAAFCPSQIWLEAARRCWPPLCC